VTSCFSSIQVGICSLEASPSQQQDMAHQMHRQRHKGLVWIFTVICRLSHQRQVTDRQRQRNSDQRSKPLRSGLALTHGIKTGKREKTN
jgi:hypothetical protein